MSAIGLLFVVAFVLFVLIVTGIFVWEMWIQDSLARALGVTDLEKQIWRLQERIEVLESAREFEQPVDSWDEDSDLWTGP